MSLAIRFKAIPSSAALCSLIALSSCISSSLEKASSGQSDRRLQVIATFIPITSFTKAVVGDRTLLR